MKRLRRACCGALLFFAALLFVATPGPLRAFEARSFDASVLDSVVSVLPLWPGYQVGGDPAAPPGIAPEGSAVAIGANGILVTALHVVEQAVEITIRLRDGRRLPASLVGGDPSSDLAVLKVEAEVPPLPIGETPPLGASVCAVGNQFGLDLSVTCGVVSASGLSGTGFNPVEDFIQTDAAVNPGSSGGALVDSRGRLVGILSAIFTKDSDANIGVNFAASMALVQRVTEDLIAQGRVIAGRPGFRYADLEREERTNTAGAKVIDVMAESAAAEAGLQLGDIITAVAGRSVRKASDLTAGLYLQRPGGRFALEVLRDGAERSLDLLLPP